MKKLILLICILMLITSGCSTKKLDNRELRYNLEIKSVVNVEEYKEVFEDILTYREFDSTAKLLIQDKYQDVIKPNVFEQFNTLTNSMKLIYPGIATNTMEIKEGGEYPIYNKEFDIIGYGTHEEYEQSIRESYHYPMNEIENIEASSDKLIVKVNNKYNGIIYIYAYMSNGQITYINILK